MYYCTIHIFLYITFSKESFQDIIILKKKSVISKNGIKQKLFIPIEITLHYKRLINEI